MVRYKFRAFRTARLGIVYRPFIRVKLINGSYAIAKEFLVDAGADITLIPLHTEKALRLSPPQPGEIFPLGGIGGVVPTVYRTVKMQIGNYHLEARIAWAQSENIPLLLGRTDVFDFFKITFDQTDRVTIFTRKKKASRD
jgi:hypothetical protein